MWTERPLAELATITSGGTPSRDVEAFWDGEIPWVTPTDISACDTNVLSQTKERISRRGLSASSARLVPAGSILLTSRATVGEARIAGLAVSTNQGFKSLTATAAMDSRFLFYQVQRCRGLFERYAAGSTFVEIGKRDTSRIPIAHPIDVEQQRRIATILVGIDNAIESTEALIAKHQLIKTGLMYDLFTRGIGADGRIRPTTDSVHTKFGAIPAQWRLGSILELTDRDRQAILTGPFGADLGSGDFVEEGVPVLRIGNVQAGRLDIEDLLHVAPRKAELLARYRVKEGDLLFARQGATTGRNALADDRVSGSLINYHIIRVALDHRRCAPLFVEAAFNCEVIKRQIERDKGRGTREGINTAQIVSLEFPIADVEEQRRISAVLTAQNNRIESERAVLASLRMQKAGLMQDLLTGKVRVPLAETASA